MKQFFAALSLILCTAITYAQSPVEKRNRAVFNRIEYFFNTNATDSIYALASEDFRKSINITELTAVLENIYPLGRMSDAQPVTFSNNIAGYNIRVGTQGLMLLLGVDSTYHYNFFQIKERTVQAVRKTEEVVSKVQKQSPLDFHIDSIAKTYIQTKNTSSLSVGIIHNGKTNTFFYGETELGKKILPTENTLYEIGSITKVFTAVVLANLVENGSITLDDSITKYLPDSLAQNPFLQKITFKTLANHTSGLPRMATNWDKGDKFTATDPYANYDRTALFAYLKDVKSTKEPGETYEYSNIGYGLLGELISTIANKPLSTLYEEVITKPLHMENTVEKTKTKTQQLAKVYDENGNETPLWSFQALSGAGSLKSSIKDLLTFCKVQFVMPSSSLEHAMAATRLFTHFAPPNTDIGLAWHMSMAEGMTYYWHNGGTGGSSAFIALIPDQKSALIVLSNSKISVDEVSLKILGKILTTQ